MILFCRSPDHPPPSRPNPRPGQRYTRIGAIGVVALFISGCSLSDWSLSDLWSSDEPAYTRLESDLPVAPPPEQMPPPAPAPYGQQPGYGNPAYPIPNAGAQQYAYPPATGYYPMPPMPSVMGGAGGMVMPDGCPVPGFYGYAPLPQPYAYPYPVYPGTPPLPPPAMGVPGAPGPASQNRVPQSGLSPPHQFTTAHTQTAPTESELASAYQALHNCSDVGGDSLNGFYCDDYE